MYLVSNTPLVLYSSGRAETPCLSLKVRLWVWPLWQEVSAQHGSLHAPRSSSLPEGVVYSLSQQGGGVQAEVFGQDADVFLAQLALAVEDSVAQAAIAQEASEVRGGQ